MKQNLVIATIFILTILTSCKSQNSDGVFYDENNTNRTKEIQTFNNQLYVLGQHNFTDKNIERTTSILCIDTLFKKIWDIHFGDNKNDERFENFGMDKQGNLYITGHNSNSKSSLLIKTNSNGQTIWRKEFQNIVSLNQIKFINDTSIIVAGTNRFSETEIIRDSSFIQKIDSSGNTIWKTPICKDGGLRFLELSENKIIFCLNAGIFNGQYPNSKCFILNENGEIEKSVDLDQASTGIDLGVKVIQLKINKRNKIAILCLSHNPRNLKMQLIQLDNNGNKFATLEYGDKNLNSNTKESDKLFMNSGMNISGGGKKPTTIVVKESNNGELYFTQLETDNKTSFTNSIELNNKIYTIGDINDFEKHTSKWKVTKTE